MFRQGPPRTTSPSVDVASPADDSNRTSAHGQMRRLPRCEPEWAPERVPCCEYGGDFVRVNASPLSSPHTLDRFQGLNRSRLPPPGARAIVIFPLFSRYMHPPFPELSLLPRPSPQLPVSFNASVALKGEKVIESRLRYHPKQRSYGRGHYAYSYDLGGYLRSLFYRREMPKLDFLPILTSKISALFVRAISLPWGFSCSVCLVTECTKRSSRLHSQLRVVLK